MVSRFALAATALLVAAPGMAEPLSGEAARRFVAGKLFAFNCFDGSRGSGRIYGDGSVIGSIQFNGSGPVRSVWLPAGTLHIKGEAVCATLKGMPFDPCFRVERTDDRSFRGSVSGMGFAYCDFSRRMNVAGMASRAHAAAQPTGTTTEAAAR